MTVTDATNILCGTRVTLADGTKERIDRIVNRRMPVKVLGNGDIDRALTVEAHEFSRTARQKIEQAGGQARVLGVESGEVG